MNECEITFPTTLLAIEMCCFILKVHHDHINIPFKNIRPSLCLRFLFVCLLFCEQVLIYFLSSSLIMYSWLIVIISSLILSYNFASVPYILFNCRFSTTLILQLLLLLTVLYSMDIGFRCFLSLFPKINLHSSCQSRITTSSPRTTTS